MHFSVDIFILIFVFNCIFGFISTFEVHSFEKVFKDESNFYKDHIIHKRDTSESCPSNDFQSKLNQTNNVVNIICSLINNLKSESKSSAICSVYLNTPTNIELDLES